MVEDHTADRLGWRAGRKQRAQEYFRRFEDRSSDAIKSRFVNAGYADEILRFREASSSQVAAWPPYPASFTQRHRCRFFESEFASLTLEHCHR